MDKYRTMSGVRQGAGLLSGYFTSTKTENDGMTVNRATRKSRIHVGGANRLHHKEMLLRGGFEHPRGEDKKEESP